ncbi:hypothetical protein [Hymenobacter armeniacus]|uniref:Uncharacterized protein n=1 Tax=Hymenobacter armeniacus TaxID=2771358 RepID=A0ABR8JPH8_9BACT|nr:hypothetical protein [Hymenobacter armeniacus]MBD2720808.1 hypothetical protein [Hymenobacter armeniacus]
MINRKVRRLATNDLLLEWKQMVSAKKFRTGRATEKVFQDALNTELVLRAFFDAKDYTYTKNRNPDNYLIALLTSNEEKDIYLLNEMAKLITYWESRKLSVALKSKNGKVEVNHASLSQLLFEVYVDMMLRGANIETVSDMTYTTRNGNEKPLDNYFEFDGKKYLVECFRPNEPVNKSVISLNMEIMKMMEKKQIMNYQAFRGHVGFKTNTDLHTAVNEARNKVEELYLNYLSETEKEGLAVMYPKKFVSDKFDIEIVPYYLGNTHEKERDLDLYNPLVSFETEPSQTLYNGCSIVISGTRMTQHEALNEKLAKKIKGKRDQHRDAPFNKIIFIELDETIGFNANTPMFPYLSREQLDTKSYREATEKNSDVIHIFVLKKATNKGIDKEFKCLYNPIHTPLINTLKKLENFHHVAQLL